MEGRRVNRARGWRAGAAFAILVFATLLANDASATIRYGDIQISGNLETQQLLRLDRSRDEMFQAFDLVQQRNTLRLQYEHDLVNREGKLLGLVDTPFVKTANLFLYYRLVYDSVYDIEPGPFFKTQAGFKAGGFDTFTNRERAALALENRLREAFIDLEFKRFPVSFRIGRQQIVWGNAVNFRAIDTVNALDLSWHLQQEAGLLGKVGFSELRIPAWAFKLLYNIGDVGPFANTFVEAFDIPFEFNPTRVRLLPRPWSLPLRGFPRGGIVTPVSGLLPDGPFLQVCFDTTGNRQTNSEANPDFSRAAENGLCPTPGKQTTSLAQGVYDDHDPGDVNQFGARIATMFSPLALGIGLNYKHQRHLVDATGGAAAKSHARFVASSTATTLQFVQPTPHSTVDPLTGRTTDTLGFVRIPIEFYYPYINVFGLNLDYFNEFTAAVYNLEVGASKGVPITALIADPAVPGIRKTWEMEIALLIDRPTWIRFLNPRSTWTMLLQGNLSYLPFRQKLVRGPDPLDTTPPINNIPLQGDVGSPSSDTTPGLFDGEVAVNCTSFDGTAPCVGGDEGHRLDQRRKFEYLTVFAMTTFYWGGSLAPLFAWVGDWTNAPAMAWIATIQYLPIPSLIVEPTLRVFWTNGRVVDDRYSVSRLAGRSELQLKFTYQF